MIRVEFSDGPAGGETRFIGRAPFLLRVTLDPNASDQINLDGVAAYVLVKGTRVLDQLKDRPRPHERVIVYRRYESGERHEGAASERGTYAHYTWVEDTTGQLRTPEEWQAWATEYAKDWHPQGALTE